MSPRLTNWLKKITPWIIGALLSTAGMMLGYGWGSGTAELLGGEPEIWARIGKGFVWGGVIAGLQWPIVRSAGVPFIWYILSSSVGFAAGYPLGQTFQAITVTNLNLQLTGYWLAIATFGLFLSAPQWWILQKHLKRSSLWFLFSMAGWMLTGVGWLNGGRDGFEYGIFTGLGLVWLVYYQRSKVNKDESSHKATFEEIEP